LLRSPGACSTTLPRPVGHDFDRSDLASTEQAIRQPLKIGRQIGLRFAGANARFSNAVRQLGGAHSGQEGCHLTR
jgi:hypothetical protein